GLENNASTESPSTISPINPTIPARAKSSSPPNALPAWPLPIHAAYGLHGAFTAVAQTPRATLAPMRPAPATMPGGAAAVSFRSRDADVIWTSLPHWLFGGSENTGPAGTRAVEVIVMVKFSPPGKGPWRSRASERSRAARCARAQDGGRALRG